MKKFILLAILLSSTASFAIPGNNGGGNGGCGIGQQTNGCGGNDNGGSSNDVNDSTSGFNSSSYSSSSNQIGDISNVNRSSNRTTVSSNNTNTVGNSNSNTNGSLTSNSTSVYKQASAPAIAPNVAASGNNGVSVGVQTIAGGFSGGFSKVDKSQKAVNYANAEFARSAADGVKVDNLLKLEGCNSEACDKARSLILRRLR